MANIEKTLCRFSNNGDLREACMSLLDYFKIKFTQISPASLPPEMFFEDKFASKNAALIDKIENISAVGIASQDTFQSLIPATISQEDWERLRENDHYKEMAFFSIEVSSALTRTEIAAITRAFNRRMHYRPVVLFFRFGELLTMATCERSEYIKSGYEGEKVGKVTILRDINCSNTHRGHKDILESLDISECESFDDVYSKWLQTFSNELLTKKFYEQLYRWYQWAIEPSTGVTFPNIVGNTDDDQADTSTSIIRLITRILFVWFIKQKGLTPDKLFETSELSNILKDFNPQDEHDSQYYNAILQNLFFATLNNQIDNRSFADTSAENNPHEGVKTLFRDNDVDSWFSIPHEEVINIFRPIPFMNCGLFECLDKYANADIDTNEDNFMDGFSSLSEKQDGHFKYRAFIPNRLFFAEEHQETVTVEDENKKLKKEKIKVSGLIPLLRKYQFTVEENTPTDVEVSLDPELLGQVFENLLATYNPQTHASARKSTGSFYTPRKIVEYMVNESLIEYLNTQVNAEKEDTWRTIIGYDDAPFELSEPERELVLEKILNCKVLDPACGSGAFPMGMLQQMVHIVRKIDPTNEMWRELVLERTQEEISELLQKSINSKDGSKELEERRQEVLNAFDNSIDNPDYTRKLYIIQNCIYGSDIQPIAMLISKLRFFISLICEQDTSKLDFDDSAHNYGINTLPNLETKFVAADSLANAKVREFEDDGWFIDKNLVQLKNELLNVRQSHFMANSQEKKLSKRADDEKKRREIYNYILNQAIKPDETKLESWSQRLKELKIELKSYAEEVFQEVEVITQANLFEAAKSEFVIKDINKEKRDSIEKSIRILEKNISKEKNKENKAGFISAVNQITDWNPYDQIKPAPFFDPDWMFNVKDGFDIVIGNPPYFQTKKGIYSALQYPFSEGKDPGKQNMYKLFVEHSYNNAKEDGIACMIVQSSLMCDLSSSHTRELLLNHTCLKQIVEFPKIAPTKEGQVFASVCQGTCIYLFRKQKADGRPFMLSVNNDCTTLSTMQKDYINKDALVSLYPKDYAIPLLRPNEFPILQKIKRNSIMLKEYVKSYAKGDMNLGTYASEICSLNTGILLMRGANIYPYKADYSVIEYIKKGFRKSYVEKNKKVKYLLWRDISGTVDPRRLICSISDTNQTVLYGDTINKIELKSPSLLPYFEALFNSQLFDWVFRKTSSNNHASCSEIILLPVVLPDDLSKLNQLVMKRKSTTGSEISALDERINDIIYNTYGLSLEERKLIQNYYV